MLQTTTAKFQIIVSEQDKSALDETMAVYRDACNYVSGYIFDTHDLKQASLNTHLYRPLREQFGKSGYITGFTSDGAYIKDGDDNYITLPNKNYKQVGISKMKFECHNNNWQYIVKTTV